MLSMWKQRRRNEITHLNSDHQFLLLFFFSGLSKRSGSSGLSLPLYHLVTAKITIPKVMIRKFSIQNSNLTLKLMSSMLLIAVTLIRKVKHNFFQPLHQSVDKQTQSYNHAKHEVHRAYAFTYTRNGCIHPSRTARPQLRGSGSRQWRSL